MQNSDSSVNTAATEDTEMDDIEELDDGSAIVKMPEAPESEDSDHYSNLAETLPDFDLNTLSSDLLDLIAKDKEARKKRDEQQEEGLRRTGLGDDAPGGATFDGASKVVHPVLAEGCVDFSARAMKELFPAAGPVKTKLHGEQSRPTLDKARRKRDYLNWQLTTQIEEYRPEKEILLTQLPLGGSQYEKYWFDPAMGRIRMEFVPIDEVLLPYAATSFYTSPRMTHMQTLTKHVFEERIRSGFYKDVTNLITEQVPEETASQQANNKIEGKDDSGYNEDGCRLVYETKCWRELEDDDQPRPYIIHTDASTTKILAIYRNWSEDDEKAQPRDWWVEDKFIPWRGAYGIGLLHLIGSLAGSATGALRALLDSAHINNAATAVKLKGGRASGQTTVVDVTSVQEIEAPPGTDDIRKVMMPMPFNPPSAVLFQLLEWITNQAKGVVATAEERISQASNTMPVGTALALIEQGSQVFSSIHARLHASQARALRIICRLNFENPEPHREDMARYGLVPEDFKDNDDIEPVSDPNIFSEAQRYAQLQEELKLAQMFPDLQWNRFELAKRALELLRIDHSDEILPKPPEPFTGDPVTENMKALMGAPLKASPEQDHLAHLQEHIRCLNDPLLGGNPLFPGPLLQNIMANCAQHLVFLYGASAMTAATVRMAQTGGQEREKTIAEAAGAAMAAVSAQLPGLVEALTKTQQLVASKMPPPQQDPAVAATLQAAMAETERRKAVDAQTFQLKQAEFQRDSQFQGMEAQLKAQAQMQKDGMDKMLAQIQLMKNAQDNESKAKTDLQINKDDNDTNIIIEQMKQEMLPMLKMLELAVAGREQQAAALSAPTIQGEA